MNTTFNCAIRTIFIGAVQSFIYLSICEMISIIFGLDIYSYSCSQHAIMDNYPPLLSDKCLTIELNAIHAFEICQIGLRWNIIMDTCDLVIKRNAICILYLEIVRTRHTHQLSQHLKNHSISVKWYGIVTVALYSLSFSRFLPFRQLNSFLTCCRISISSTLRQMLFSDWNLCALY